MRGARHGTAASGTAVGWRVHAAHAHFPLGTLTATAMLLLTQMAVQYSAARGKNTPSARCSDALKARYGRFRAVQKKNGEVVPNQQSVKNGRRQLARARQWHEAPVLCQHPLAGVRVPRMQGHAWLR